MNKIVNLLGTGEKKQGCRLLPYNFSSRNKTNKQSNPLTLTVSCEKRSYLIRSKKKKLEPITKSKKKQYIKK